VITANLAALLIDQGGADDEGDGTSIADRPDRIEAPLAALTSAISRQEPRAGSRDSGSS
jgi:hypothetical protein